MSDELKSNKGTTGTFDVRVDGEEPLKQDLKSFDVKEGSVEVSVLEGIGGPMAPRRHLLLSFEGGCPNGRFEAASLLKVDYADWSDMHSYRYKAKSGWVEVESRGSPRRIVGNFEMVVEIYENSPPGGAPLVRQISGAFDLINN
ncbi:hypothetical protein [Pseudomonas sp. RT6P73]